MPDGDHGTDVSSSIASGLIALNERIEKARIPSSEPDETFVAFLPRHIRMASRAIL